MSIVSRSESLLRALEATGVDRILRPWLAGRGVIFLMHRVAPAGASVLDPDEMVTADLLRAAVRLALAEGYEPIGLDDLPARLQHTRRGRFVVFSFDDGYRDNLTVAHPIMRSLNVPWCLYVAVGLVDRAIDYWWGALARVAENNVVVDLSAFGMNRAVPIASRTDKLDAFRRIQSWVHADLEPRIPVALRWCRGNGVDDRAALDADVLTWNELRELARDPLVTIGAHTVTHRRLSRLDERTALDELVDARTRLEKELSVRVKHLAYPYGGRAACGRREARLAREAGYTTAVTTRRGNVFAAHATDLQLLPRRRIIEGAPDLRTVARGLAGTQWFLSRGARIVTD